MPQLRAETIVRFAQHARCCDRRCTETFVCRGCRKRYGECCRDAFIITLCTRCRRKQLASDSERG